MNLNQFMEEYLFADIYLKQLLKDNQGSEVELVEKDTGEKSKLIELNEDNIIMTDKNEIALKRVKEFTYSDKKLISLTINNKYIVSVKNEMEEV